MLETLSDEEKSSAEELALMQARYAAIIASSDDAIMSKTLDGIITSWNPAAVRMFGYTEQEALGQPMAMLIPANRADEEPQIIARIRRGERVEHFETVRVRKDGKLIDIAATISPMLDANGRIMGASKIVRDISERVSILQAVHDSEARLSAILDNVLDGILTINEVGTVESMNRAACRIFGYDVSEVIGKNVKMLMPEPYHGEHDGYLHNYVSTGHKKIIGIGRQVVGLRKDGSTFPMDLAVSEMQLKGWRLFTGVVRDITERVRIERMKSEFISTVSHELRTPLTSIRGSLGLVTGGIAGVLPEQAKTLIDIASKNCERLIQLVNDILDMEKIEAGRIEFQLQPVLLNPFLQQAVEASQDYAKQYNVRYELKNELPDVMLNVDGNRLMQILANLLSNAAKFSPAGDKVDISVIRNGASIRVAVSDHGIGISDEFRGQVFTRFAQADSSDTRKKGGTGLGLAITKELVERMGGSIGFDSQPHVLTTFFIEFPEWKQAAVAVSDETDWKILPDRMRNIQQEPSSSRRVLICEDDHDIAALLRMMLQQHGLSADIAYSATQAKQMLAQGDYAAMTLDLGLPDQDGVALIRELRETAATAELPIVVISATAVEGKKELNGDAFNVVDWLCKPINPDRLESSIKQALGRISGRQPSILHVEDDNDIFQIVKSIVGNAALLEQAGSLAEAKQSLNRNRYDLVILDLGLPDGSGAELLPVLNSTSPPTPVMVFSANELGSYESAKADAVLVKSRTDNEQLLATIKRLINGGQ
ncbi:MAG: PAS domain S-box protein [Nitrosospira sp.]|nr:PAS domain S-box protein [Nitrosospira sp.]